MSLPNSNDKPTAWTDSDGRTWSMAITVNDNRRVLKLLGIDLFDLFDGKLLERLSREPILLVDTLYAVCKPQADERGVSEEQFAELLITGKKRSTDWRMRGQISSRREQLALLDISSRTLATGEDSLLRVGWVSV